MGHNSKYHGTYPSQWSEWDWNVQHSRYVRYRLVSKDEYEWDTYNPTPPQEFADDYHHQEQYPENTSESTYESTSDFHSHESSSQQSDRDSGYHSDSPSSTNGFDDLLDHPDTWTVNPFLAYGFPPAKDSSSSSSSPRKHHHHQSKHSKSQHLGLDISRTSLHSDEGFSEPKQEKDSWITLLGKHNKEVNLQPTIDHGSQVCYVSHSVLKDLGLWDKRRVGKGREAWISRPGLGEGEVEEEKEKVKIVGSWAVSWGVTFKGNGNGNGNGNGSGRSGSKIQRTVFKVFKDKRRRVVLGMSSREARKLGISG